MTTWGLLSSGPTASAFNMALDDVLLGEAPRMNFGVLRFYSWLESAATFGFFQKYGEVAQWTPLRPLIRRPTAGGLVCHQADWTYSLIVPPSDPWYSLPASKSYQRLHQWLQGAFAAQGITTELCPERLPTAAGQCFVGAEKNDLLWQGRKIAGAAQRRTRTGLLIQGSVQPPPQGAERADWERAMANYARIHWGTNWIPFEPDALLLAKAQELAVQKYSQDHFNRRR